MEGRRAKRFLLHQKGVCDIISDGVKDRESEVRVDAIIRANEIEESKKRKRTYKDVEDMIMKLAALGIKEIGIKGYGIDKPELVGRMMEEWQDRWMNVGVGRWTYELLRGVDELRRVGIEPLRVSFGSYLKRIGKREKEECAYCGAELDEARHVLVFPRWAAEVAEMEAEGGEIENNETGFNLMTHNFDDGNSPGRRHKMHGYRNEIQKTIMDSDKKMKKGTAQGSSDSPVPARGEGSVAGPPGSLSDDCQARVVGDQTYALKKNTGIGEQEASSELEKPSDIEGMQDPFARRSSQISLQRQHLGEGYGRKYRGYLQNPN
ncbi:hypothetical protein FQA39_LY03166 [Lamprigera yunnana]|nr:hypothetical protein FQA39_LY03166 [Lamprigera yunnana]